MINEVKIESGYVRYLGPIILEMSLDKFWDCFYADDAPYYVSDIKKDPKDEFVEATKWHAPSEEQFEMAFGKPVQSERSEEWIIHVDNSPFTDHSNSKAVDLLVERTEVNLEFKKIMISWGSLYADRFQIWLKFETVTADPRSKFVVVVPQYKFVWVDEPWGVGGWLQEALENWTKKELHKMPDWFELHR